MGNKRKAYLALGVVCIVWGISWVGTKEAVREMPPFQMVGVRQILAGLCYIVFFAVKRHPLPKGRQWAIILLLSFLNFMVSNSLATWGVKLTTAGLSAILGAIFPLWLVIILTVRGKSRIPPLAWVGILLGITGVCIVFYENLHLLFDYSFLGGILLGLIAALSWAFGTVYTKDFAGDFNPYYSIGWQMLISGVVLNIGSYAFDATVPLSSVSMHTWWAIILLVVVSSVLAFLAYLYALQNLPTSLVAIYAYINPIVAVLAGSVFVDEPLTLLIMLGAIVTLCGVYIVNRALQRVKASE